jgi:hypothetical protein
MHNMIIENKHGQDLDYSFYDLIGQPVCVQRREEKVTRFINSYHAIWNNEIHDGLQSNRIEEWWKRNGQQSHYLHLHILNYLRVELFEEY